MDSSSPEWSLMIHNVRLDDAGLYECQVMWSSGSEKVVATENGGRST